MNPRMSTCGLLRPLDQFRVQILQHPYRQAQGKGAWTYSLILFPAPAKSVQE